MDTCASCDTKLTPDIEWCPQCYAPVGPPRPGAPGSAIPRSQQTAASSVQVQGSAGPSNGLPPGQAPLPVWAQGSIRGMAPTALHEAPKYSRVKGGETSFGFMGRLMLSIGVVIVALVGYPAIIGNVGVPMTWGTFEIYLPAAVLVSSIVILRIWRPSRVDSRHP